MNEKIEAILFDMGGTLRTSVKPNSAEKTKAIHRIIDLLGTEMEEDELFTLLRDRGRKYQEWAECTRNELSEEELWIKWMLPDWSADTIRPIAVQLNEAFRDSYSKRIIFEETVEIIVTLYRRGYRLGLVSNTTSSVEIPEVLRALKIRGYFDVVLLSTLEGKRKPDDSLLRKAAQSMGVKPGACAYIGDQPRRDVASARKAGFSRAIILRDPRNQHEMSPDDAGYTPDNTITNLRELFEIFPQRGPISPPQVYNASLSTMWATKNFISLADFFEFARRAGFASVELNHKVNSAMLEGIDLKKTQIPSIHEPCPADIPVETLVKEDWMISALDEDNRHRGVDAVKRTIHLANQIGAKKIIVHAGHIQMDTQLEKQLRALIEDGKFNSLEFREIQHKMLQIRYDLAIDGFPALQKSIAELLDYARPFGICLGLENRSHFREFPSPDELENLLGMSSPEYIGFIFDVGHAKHLSRLGFYPFDEWLKRFSQRMIGTHLHDVRGLNDHLAAGLGELDFDKIAGYLPESAFRTCEFLDSNTADQVKLGLKTLFEENCIRKN